MQKYLIALCALIQIGCTNIDGQINVPQTHYAICEEAGIEGSVSGFEIDGPCVRFNYQGQAIYLCHTPCKFLVNEF